MLYLLLATFLGAGIASPVQEKTQCPLRIPQNEHAPPPPAPELIEISRLPLPPVVDGDEEGVCTAAVNPRGTGCTGKATNLQGGTFLPDDSHVLARLTFAGAPASPDPAGVCTGEQVIMVRTDGSVFPNGDAWKCLTCGVSKENNHAIPIEYPDYGYPQAFADGKRVMAGFYIIDCGDFDLASASTFFARLQFDLTPTKGLPLGPRYNLVHVNRLMHAGLPPPVYVTGGELHFNHSAITVGELRGFSGTGSEVTYVGYPVESCNIDIFAAYLRTGHVRRLTTHPGYVDPVHMSPDDGSMVIMDTRGSGRTEFMDGMRGIPPIADILTTTVCSSVRNNGQRRFFQPWLLDRYGDRGDYYGQEINGASTGIAGSGDIDDPEWNGGADPWFSNDGTQIVYYQAQTVPPACGGKNPLPCYNSTEPGGRMERLMLARLVERSPLPVRKISKMSDRIPWAAPYVVGEDEPSPSYTLAGNYTLNGEASGYASIDIVKDQAKTSIQTIKVRFENFSDDGLSTLHGTQNISRKVESYTINTVDWYSDLRREGQWSSRQSTSFEGFHMSIDVLSNIFTANGTLTTVAEGLTFKQPQDGT